MTYENTATGADGRYHFSNLPEGWAVLHAYSGTLRQMCAASATLESTTQLDVEVTSAADPQPSKAPLTITGQIYETTAAGRVGVGGAGIEIQWANDGLLLQVFPDASGHYTACGIPANRPIAFWTLPPSYDVYDSPYTWHQFSTDATLDIELKRSH